MADPHSDPAMIVAHHVAVTDPTTDLTHEVSAPTEEGADARFEQLVFELFGDPDSGLPD